MTYLFILPVFVLAVAGLGVASLVAASVPELRPVFPFLWRIWLWSTMGFVAANVVLFVLVQYFVPFLERVNMASGEGALHSILNLTLAVVLLAGPFVVSAIGFLGGAALGMWFATRVSRPNQPLAADERPA